MCEAQLICLGRLFAALSVSQHCLIALLSAFFFSLHLESQPRNPHPEQEKKEKKRKSEDHLPMVIGEWESEIEAVADT